MIVSDRVYRCYATQVAHSSNYLQYIEQYEDRQTSHTEQSVFKQPICLVTTWDTGLRRGVIFFLAVYF